jgi:hypothetical protein
MILDDRVDECWEDFLRKLSVQQPPVAHGAGVGRGEQAKVPNAITISRSISLVLSPKLIIRQGQLYMCLIIALIQIPRS